MTLSADTDDHCAVEPSTVEEALNNENKEKWKAAMDKEFNSRSKTMHGSSLIFQKGRKSSETSGCLKLKRTLMETLAGTKRALWRKVLLKNAVDYDETFSPVIRYSTLRMLFALAAELNSR